MMLSPRGQTGIKANILASALSIWPQPDLGLVNLALRNVQDNKINAR